jgi:isoamylase
MRVWPGRAEPRGVTVDAGGVNVALFSAEATAVEVCLFDPAGLETRVALPSRTESVWHGYLPGVRPGARYGFRVHGPWEPAAGRWFNPAKLLADPYARRLSGRLVQHEALRAVAAEGGPDPRDTAAYVPLSVVAAEPRPARRPALRPWADTVIYELHVRGFTKRMPEVPERLRGTYAGLASPAAVRHLTRLGVTAVELLPVHASVTERSVAGRGLVNYWGYNTLGYFAPDPRYSAGEDPVAEFRAMVDALHAAGIEVLLDVVYNHTAEGPPDGPTLSLRGIDNRAYYRLDPADNARYRDYTGCGNTLDVRTGATLRLILDSLRYWVSVMGVDGFRFDLASALARGDDGVDEHSPFLAAVGQDPVLRDVRLIAEPWDLGSDGYRVGGFGAPWAEWNGRYRDAVRDFWRGELPRLAELGTRLAGSEDLYGPRGPHASVNFLTAHDGFTLRDLVSYRRKHNAANGERGADGTDDNRSVNFGAEGDTADPEILALRRKQVRNLLATLLLSAGTPMLLAGDELGNTQHGNNNAYCQDNEVSWVDWSTVDSELLEFTRSLLALRAAEPVFRRAGFFTGSTVDDRRDITWYRPDAQVVTDADWQRPGDRTLGAYLDGKRTDRHDRKGRPQAGRSYLLWLHSGQSDVDILLPPAAPAYSVAFDTAGRLSGRYRAGAALWMPARSVLLLRAGSR